MRQARKQLGLAASSESQIIGDMANELGKGVREYLGYDIVNVTIAVPFLDALYEEDIWDGLE